MIRELPDPVVQPRPRQYSKEELAALKKEMLAEYNKSKQSDGEVEPSPPSTAHVGADASVRPAPAQPVRETKPGVAHAVRNSMGGKTIVDPTRRKPPAAVKEVAAPQERKNKAYGVSRGKFG